MLRRLGLVAVLLGLHAASGHAAELRDLAPTLAEGQVQVSFQLAGAFDQETFDRVESGLPTTFTYQVELLRDRKRWWNDQLADATLEVVAMYNAVSKEYLVNFKRDGNLVESRLARSREELEAAMTRFERVPLFAVTDLKGDAGSRFVLKARAELGSKTWLSFIPVHVNTDWTQSRKFRASEP
jgi:Domain of unknown function (DUF4390)